MPERRVSCSYRTQGAIVNDNPDSTTADQHHGCLADLCQYPLMSALVERRTRRVARGTSLESGPLSHRSSNAPAPLSKLEEAVLICSLGVTGVTTHDGPLNKPGGGHELGTPFLNIVARTGSSADNCQATSFFLINDEGIWLLKYPQGRAALSILKDLSPNWADWKEQEWIQAADQVKVRISERRMEFPREYPYYLGWNAQLSNVPGSTIFFPVVDCTRQYINALLILLAEPDGKRPLFVERLAQVPAQGNRRDHGLARRPLGFESAHPLPAHRRTEVDSQWLCEPE